MGIRLASCSVAAMALIAACRAEVFIAAGGSGGGTASTASVAITAPASSVASSGAGGGDVDLLLRACAIAASCAADGKFAPHFTASSCLDGFALLGWHYRGSWGSPDPVVADHLVNCAKNADCKAFTACYGGDWVDLSRCREGAECLGNAIGSGSPSFDCGSIGAKCANLGTHVPRACCNAKPCTQIGSISCDGNKASGCGGFGEWVEIDCGAAGLVCKVGAPTYTPCSGGGAKCDEAAAVSCSGSVASYCLGGSIATHDCATTAFQTSCAKGQSSYAPCKASGAECDPPSFLGDCDGGDLLVCADGFKKHVSCAALGFAKCIKSANGVARCAS